MEDLKRRVDRLEDCVEGLGRDIALISGQMSTVALLVKWVITPLLVILGAGFGVKIIMP